MTIALVSATVFQTPSGGGTGASNANGGSAINTTGATLLTLCYGGQQVSPTPTISDNYGNTWTALTNYNYSDRPASACQIFYCQNPTVGTGHVATFTCPGGTYATCEFQAWSGAATSSVLDSETGASGGYSSTSNTGSLTPAENGCLILTVCSYADNTSGAGVSSGFSTPSGAYINTLGNAYGGFNAYQIQATAASISADWNLGSGGGFQQQNLAIAAFKPSAGVSYTLSATHGSFAITGEAAGLLFKRKLAALQGSYVLTGESAGLKMARKLAAAQGSYGLSGQAANLLAKRKLTASQGSYALTGEAAGLRKTWLLSAAHGAYSLAGQAVTLTYSGVTRYVLACATGIYSLTGQAVNFIRGKIWTPATPTSETWTPEEPSSDIWTPQQDSSTPWDPQ